MPILLIVALVLAWPTYGGSLLVWGVLLWRKAKKEAEKSEARRQKVQLIEPLFENSHIEFFKALNVPIKDFAEPISDENAHECCRHVISYIAHNPSELDIFLRSLKKWARPDGVICNPVTALRIEQRLAGCGELRPLSLRAVKAVAAQNPYLRCFRDVDVARLEAQLFTLADA